MRKYHPPLKVTPELEARFWNKADRTPDGCWVFHSGLSAHGYGTFAVTHRQSRRSNRVAYELAFGPVPENMLVCHTCDNRLCVRPSHLYAGTDSDNMRDKLQRHGVDYVPPPRRGESNNKAKLTDAQVLAMRQERQEGKLLRELAASYGISVPVVSKVCRYEMWRHV